MKNTKRTLRILAAALCAVLLLSSVPALAESYATVRGGGLNLRQTASLDAKVLGQYRTGTWITVLESGKEWSKVKVDGGRAAVKLPALSWNVIRLVKE